MDETIKRTIQRALRSYRHWKARIGNNELTIREWTEIRPVRLDMPPTWGSTPNPTAEDAVTLQELMEENKVLRRLTMRIEFAIGGLPKRERELVELRYFDGLMPSTIMQHIWHVEKSEYYRTHDSAMEGIYASLGREGVEDFERHFARRQKATA